MCSLANSYQMRKSERKTLHKKVLESFSKSSKTFRRKIYYSDKWKRLDFSMTSSRTARAPTPDLKCFWRKTTSGFKLIMSGLLEKLTIYEWAHLNYEPPMCGCRGLHFQSAPLVRLELKRIAGWILFFKMFTRIFVWINFPVLDGIHLLEILQFLSIAFYFFIQSSSHLKFLTPNSLSLALHLESTLIGKN